MNTSEKRSTGKKNASSGTPLPIVIDALAGDLRRALLVKLGEEPSDVSTLADDLNVELSQVSHNLRRLKQAGLVTSTKESRFRVYELRPCVRLVNRHEYLELAVQAKDGQRIALKVKASEATRRRKRRS